MTWLPSAQVELRQEFAETDSLGEIQTATHDDIVTVGTSNAVN
jgi:hypothetical protein